MGFKKFFEEYDDSSAIDWESLYEETFREMRHSARRNGINLDAARIINTKRDNLIKGASFKDVKDDQKFHQWYGIGTTWLDWIMRKQPEWLRPQTYALIIDETQITSVNSPESIQAFTREFITPGQENSPKDRAIAWGKLYNSKRNIIEFNPYLPSTGKYGWYDSIDMSSGAIVNKKAIKKVIKLCDMTEAFQDAGIHIAGIRNNES